MDWGKGHPPREEWYSRWQPPDQPDQPGQPSQPTQHSWHGWHGGRHGWHGGRHGWHGGRHGYRGEPPPWVREWAMREGWTHEDWHHRRKAFMRRFVGFFVFMLLLIVGGMAGIAFFVTRFWFWGGDHATTWQGWADRGGAHFTPLPIWIGGCGLALILPLLAIALGARAFRSYALPLADIMDAADAVAAGNFGAQVVERGSRDFRRLANSFNRMTVELARTDQQRRNLTADVAHELRTPLHIIQGNLEGILDGIYAPTPEHIEATLQETQMLARLVDDLRILSLAEAGELPLQREPVEVAELVADVITSFEAQAEAAQICLRGQTLVTTGFTIQADPGRLDQVLSNLVSNAVRHTPAGGEITLAVAPVLDPVLGQAVQISVADTGEGIAAEDLPFIFDRFWRGDRARTHQQHAAHDGGTGSGLGLAITSQLVKAHGGTITATSEPEQGTTFTLCLPIGPAFAVIP